MKNVIVITGASSGFGALAAHALACRSHRLREHARNSRPQCATDQGSGEVVNIVSDRVRAELLRRIGLSDLLVPRDLSSSK
jgi:NAD(P)-dependent dehydrogenase (short-subunit alcohol dehydrogenase family)